MLTELSSHRHVLALSIADTRAGRCRLPPPCRWSGRGTGAWPRSRPAVLSRPALRESFRPRHCVTVTSRKITVRCWNPDTGFEAARCRSFTSPQGSLAVPRPRHAHRAPAPGRATAALFSVSIILSFQACYVCKWKTTTRDPLGLGVFTQQGFCGDAPRLA